MDVSVLPMRRPNTLGLRLLRGCCGCRRHSYPRRGAAFFALWVKALVRIPVLYTPHGPHYAYTRGWRYAGAWVMECLFRLLFNAILYVSPGGKRSAAASSPRRSVAGSRYGVAGCEPCNRPISETRILASCVGDPVDRFVISWIGRFDYARAWNRDGCRPHERIE